MDETADSLVSSSSSIFLAKVSSIHDARKIYGDQCGGFEANVEVLETIEGKENKTAIVLIPENRLSEGRTYAFFVRDPQKWNPQVVCASKIKAAAGKLDSGVFVIPNDVVVMNYLVDKAKNFEVTSANEEDFLTEISHCPGRYEVLIENDRKFLLGVERKDSKTNCAVDYMRYVDFKRYIFRAADSSSK